MDADQSENEFSWILKQKNYSYFFKIKKKHGKIDAAGGTPSELKLKEYEGDVDIPYKLFSGPHM